MELKTHWLRRRSLNTFGFAACVLMMLYALYSQYFLTLDPCPLCIVQRVAVIFLGIVFLVAALHNPNNIGSRVYGTVQFLVATSGAIVAGWHVYLQSLPPDQVPACGPGLDYMLEVFSLSEVLSMVFTGSGECAEVAWRFLGLSMPAWVLIVLASLGVSALLVNWTRPRH